MWASLMGWQVQEGFAPRYAPHLMAHVASRRGMRPAACMVSSPVLPVGRWEYIYGVNTGALRHCLIVDVSAPKDRHRHIKTRRIAEIAFEDARDLCGHTTEPVESCPIIVISKGD